MSHSILNHNGKPRERLQLKETKPKSVAFNSISNSIMEKKKKKLYLIS